jgi:HlyD family secretion protein
VLAVALLVAGGVIGALIRPPEAPPRPAASQGGVATDRHERVVGLGKIVPASGVVTVAAPFGAGDARVASLRVAEGDTVEQGDIVAALDNEAYLTAAVDSARAQVEARTAAYAQVTHSVRASREELAAQLARAEVAKVAASRELARTEDLFRQGAATSQAVDQRRDAEAEATKEVARVKAAQWRFGDGSVYAHSDSVAAHRSIEVAKADLARATADLEKAFVRAPLSGTVLAVHVEQGERPGVKGILDLADLERMNVEAEIYQDQIGRVSVGDAATISARPFPEPLSGTVAEIGWRVERQGLVDLQPAANTDARTVKVTIALDAAASKAARRLTDLQVQAVITPSEP